MPAHATPKLTTYIVLMLDDAAQTWKAVLKAEFADPEAAREAAANEHGSAVYWAVAQRNFKPDRLVGRQMTVWEVVPVEEPTPARPVADAPQA